MDTARSIVHSVTHYIKNTDLYLMLLGLVCSIYGMLLIYSATLNPVTALDGSTKNLYVQGAAIILGLAAFVALSLIDLENLGDLWKIFVIGNILLQFLLFTPLGTEVNGQRAWLNLGVTSLQPGELGKLIFIFTIAAHMTEIQDHITEWRGLVSVGLHTLVMMGAVVLSSGDTGMAIQYLMIAVIMLFSAGLPLKWLGIAAGVGIASVPILWNYVLKDYQKTRILVLFDPSIDVEQSRQATYGKIAIGSGQFTGQGWTNGTMTQMQYVPENQTDYIFSVAGEELGLLGCLLIIILLMALIIRLFYVAYRASTPFSALIAVGVGGMLLFQTFMNIIYECRSAACHGPDAAVLLLRRYVHRYHVRRARHRRRRQNARKAKLAAKLIWASRPAHTLKMTEGILQNDQTTSMGASSQVQRGAVPFTACADG